MLIKNQKQTYNGILFCLKKEGNLALTGVAHWVRHHPANQRVFSLIPRQGPCLGCRPGPHLGGVQQATNGNFSCTLIFISLPFFLPSLLSKKINK